MLIKEFSKPITSATLNESLAKRFGTKIDVSKFTTEQLEDARNRLRTQLSQVETNESYEAVTQSDSYQKTKMFLDVINAAIVERSVAEAKKLDPVGKEDDDVNNDGETDSSDEYLKKRRAAIAKASSKTDEGSYGKKKKAVKEGAESSPEERLKALSDLYKNAMDTIKRTEQIMYMTPPGPNRDYYEMEVGQMEQHAEKIKKDYRALEAGMKGADDIRAKATSTESIVREGAEEEATLVMASKDMVDRVTGWMEDTAEMQTESMLELGDKIRDELGVDKSDEFIAMVKPALDSLFSSLESTRDSLTSGVAILTGEGAPQTMGDEVPADDDMDMEPIDDVDAETDAPEEEGDDEFATADASVGGDEPADRQKRESIELSRKLGTILSGKKKA